MPTPTSQELHAALVEDLKKAGTSGLDKVLNDVARKTFSAKITGAVLEFSHKQADPGFWNGVKYYGSGPNSRVRIRRTPREAAPQVEASKVAAKRAPRAKKAPAQPTLAPTS
ncbi:MAG TPA: hypothetical protein VF614_04660 [Chthoniobacteraceae bacterium]|jgi:hypothetical protein